MFRDDTAHLHIGFTKILNVEEKLEPSFALCCELDSTSRSVAFEKDSQVAGIFQKCFSLSTRKSVLGTYCAV